MRNQASSVESAKQSCEKEEKIGPENEIKYERFLGELAEDDEISHMTDNNAYDKLRRICVSHTMNERWDMTIKKQLAAIKENCGADGVRAEAKFKEIYGDYWSLLLKTSIKVGGLMTECKVERKNIQDLIEIMECDSYSKSSSGHGVNVNDMDMCEYMDIGKLGKWMKSEMIKDLIHDWEKINQGLEGTIGEWQELAKKEYKAQRKKLDILKAGGGIATIGGLVLVIAAVALSAGVALVGIVGAAGAAGVAGTAGGAGGAGGAVAYKTFKEIKIKISIMHMIRNTIMDELDGMFTTGRIMMKTLIDLKDGHDRAEIEIERIKQLMQVIAENPQRLESLRIERRLKRIDEDLNEFTKQGNDEVMHVIKLLTKKYVEN